MGLGLDYAGNRLFASRDAAEVAEELVDAIDRNAPGLRTLTAATTEGAAYRGEVQRKVIDPGDPKKAGWTFLVNERDPRRDEITRVVHGLAEHRGMADPNQPLLYSGDGPDDWLDWLHDHYFALELEGKQKPQYVLIVGSPGQVPFGFQSLLDTVANVGRVDFGESLDDLDAYVEKVRRIETAAAPVVDREAIFFGPDGGLPDPTFFSRKYMCLPLEDHVRNNLGFTTQFLEADEATKENLQEALQRKPAVVYAASHGLGATDQPADVQRRLNGAICCQSTGPLTVKSLYTADDVPAEPFLEGSLFFQFACFGYGTPAESDYAHWLDDVPKSYTDGDFVAALPRRLLAHPHGPIAYVGHLDTAFLHGFADIAAPHILERWHNRIAPFKKILDELLAVQPTGLAMQDMNTRYSLCNAIITNTYDRLQRGRLQLTPESKERFLDTWITRGDAQNYMVLGDPAARLRIP